MINLAYVFDARGVASVAACARGPAGLELGAAKIEIDATPGDVAVRAARLTLAARGGVSCDADEVFYGSEAAAAAAAASTTTTSNGPTAVAAPDPDAVVHLAVVPAAEIALTFDWRTIGGKDGCRGQDHHRHDSVTGVELKPSSSMFSLGCRLTAVATLSTKDKMLSTWRESGDVAGVDSSTPARGTPSPNLVKWRSGDFLARATDAAAAAARSSPMDDVIAEENVHSPSSPGFASAISAAAAAAVAHDASTPTIIVGPAALRWLRKFVKDFTRPPGALRRAWKLRHIGLPKKVRHPLQKALPLVFDDIDLSITADDVRVSHPTESLDDEAKGLTAHVVGFACAAKFSPPPPPASANAFRRRASPRRRYEKPPPSAVLSTLEVTLREARVLLPPADGEMDFGAAAAHRAGLGRSSGGGGGGGGGGSPRTPGSGRFDPARGLWGGLGSGNFDKEAERYKAIYEMLDGGRSGGGGSPRVVGGGGTPSPLGGGGGGGGLRGRLVKGESPSGRRRRLMATDPALVLETRSVRVVRRVDAPDFFACELRRGARGGGGGGGGDVDVAADGDASARETSWMHVTVEEPRLLKAAARRDALVRWVRDAYRAAIKPTTPKHSHGALLKIAAEAKERAAQDALAAAERAAASEKARPGGHRRGKSKSSIVVGGGGGGGGGGGPKSSKHRKTSSAALGKGLFDDDFDLLDPSAFSGAFYTLVPIRPRSRCERRSLRTLPGVSLRPPLAFNSRLRCLSTSTDAFQLHPAIRLYRMALGPVRVWARKRRRDDAASSPRLVGRLPDRGGRVVAARAARPRPRGRRRGRPLLTSRRERERTNERRLRLWPRVERPRVDGERRPGVVGGDESRPVVVAAGVERGERGHRRGRRRRESSAPPIGQHARRRFLRGVVRAHGGGTRGATDATDAAGAAAGAAGVDVFVDGDRAAGAAARRGGRRRGRDRLHRGHHRAAGEFRGEGRRRAVLARGVQRPRRRSTRAAAAVVAVVAVFAVVADRRGGGRGGGGRALGTARRRGVASERSRARRADGRGRERGRAVAR